MEAWWTANVVQPFEERLHSYNTSSNRQSADAVKKRIKLAQTTGLCNLERNLNWTRFPDFIFDVVGANKCKVVDVSENQLEEIPEKVNLLQKCTKLIVANNMLLRLPDSLHMKSLKVLNLSRNRLRKLCALDLPNLVELIVDNNELTELPESSFGTMKKLEIFSCSENRIRDVTCVSVCASLTDARCERNQIEKIPDEFAFLRKLRRLRMDGNENIRTVASDVFKHCEGLEELSLKDTKVTAEDLREVEGWESYELRRQKKVEKKIDGNVMLLNGMDDGLERKM